MNWLELLLGQIPEAIYFSLFLIFTKKLSEKRSLFTGLLTFEYVLLLNIFPYNWYFHISFMVIVYIILKIFYDDKSQITDVFLLLIGYMYLAIVSLISYGVGYLFLQNMIIMTIVNRLLLFIPIILMKNKLPNIQKLYKKYWNRSLETKRMKSITFRGLNLVLLNLTFVLINICMLVVSQLT